MRTFIVPFVVFAFVTVAGCSSVQKSVDPTGRNPIPRGPERSVDQDTIRPPGSDTSKLGLPDSVRRESKLRFAPGT